MMELGWIWNKIGQNWSLICVQGLKVVLNIHELYWFKYCNTSGSMEMCVGARDGYGMGNKRSKRKECWEKKVVKKFKCCEKVLTFGSSMVINNV